MEVNGGEPPAPYGISVTGELRAPGERLGPFEIRRCVAVTLFGALYRAYTRPAGGPILLHLLPSALARDPRLGENLRAQRDRLSAAGSDLVLAPNDIVAVGDTLAVVYPDFSGEPLSVQRRTESARFPLASMPARSLLKRVILALEVAAAADAFHFALTPDFVLTNSNGDLRIWGCGLMQAIDRHQFEIFVSSAIVPLRDAEAQADYSVLEALSPEWRNEDAVDVRADLFGVGILAYNLLTSRRLGTDWVPPSKVDPEIPEGWDVYLERLLEQDPGNRYQTTLAASSDLDRVERLGHEVTDSRSRSFRDLVRLPRPGKDRDPKPLRRGVRLLLVLVAVAAVAFGGRWLLTLMETVPRDEESPVHIAGNQTPNFVLRVTPERARVRFLDDEGASFDTVDGLLKLRAERGAYRVQVESPHHLTEEVLVELGDEPVESRVELELAWTSLRLRSLSGSRLDVIDADGERTFLDRVPENGLLEVSERLFAGSYDFVVSREGYASVELLDQVLEAGAWTELEAALVPLPAELRVLTSPGGAIVRINGEMMGETPLLIAELDVQEPIELAVGGEAFRQRIHRLQLVPGRENLVDLGDLEAASGDLRLEVRLSGSPPAASRREKLVLQLGPNAYEGVADLQLSLPAGTHPLRVEHPDFHAQSGEITIIDGEQTTLMVDLRPRSATLELVLPTHAGSDLVAEVAGEPVSVNHGRLKIPAEQVVNVKLRFRDFLPVQQSFSLTANGFDHWEPDLHPLPGPETGEPWTLPHLGAKLAWVPAGRFEMGSPLEESLRRPNEGPRTQIILSEPFWIGTTEVTQASYTALMKRNPSRFPGTERPVESVTWENAVDFCRRLTDRERTAGRLPAGYVYRLPTEAEWEYAARAGAREPFHFGSKADRSHGHFQGQYPRDYGSAVISSTRHMGTLPVARFKPNAWGLYDVHGNVREWTLDTYNDRLPGGVQTDYHRTGEGRGMSVRGGGWEDFADRSRVAARELASPHHASSNLGFRIVLGPES